MASITEGQTLQQVNVIAHHDTVVMGDLLYMWGGSEPGFRRVHNSVEKRTTTSRLKVFHLPSGQWIIKTTSGNPPLGVMGYSCSTVGDKIYYFGGWCGHDVCYHNSLNELDTVTLTWKQLQPMYDHKPVMKRGYGGMITIEFEDNEIYLLMVGGHGSPPTVPLQQAQYIQTHDGLVRTNECNMYNILTGEWTALSNVGECMPPTSDFVIENISKTRAIIYGGLINKGYHTTNSIYFIDIKKKTISWESVKVSDSINSSWPERRYCHASCTIESDHESVLVVMGGLNNGQLLNENCCWLFSVNSHIWEKIILPHSVIERYGHSISVFTVGLNSMWIAVTGGFLEKQKQIFDGMENYRGVYVSQPDITMIIELVFSDNKWSVSFVSDSNGQGQLALDQLYKQKELQNSLLHDLQVSQQTIKSLQETLQMTKEQVDGSIPASTENIPISELSSVATTEPTSLPTSIMSSSIPKLELPVVTTEKVVTSISRSTVDDSIDAIVACKVLSENIATIIQSQIPLPSFLDKLLSKNIINDADRRKIMDSKTTINIDDKWRELLDIIRATILLDEEVFLIFLNAIKEGGSRRETTLAHKLYEIYKVESTS